ncbi:MAG: adenine nucleotide alpha hydrolase [Candidatus Dormibacteraeota bacterium]|nr:adenine nucleotide alpha hydrolase [Candidatus Dormibacteraeota bacterium]
MLGSGAAFTRSIRPAGHHLTDLPLSHGGAAHVKRRAAWVSWSSGKDSAWALHRALADPTLEVRGLLTTMTTAFDRVSMHAVRRRLLEDQARRLHLPLRTVELPWPCPNQVYEAAFMEALQVAAGQDIKAVVFGDLFLEDVRAYREHLLAPTSLEPCFPLWAEDTTQLADEMLSAGLRARVTCIDPRVLDASVAGRLWDAAVLRDLPAAVDPCGERGEFHTYVVDSPDFTSPVEVEAGERVLRDGFWFADLLPPASPADASPHPGD